MEPPRWRGWLHRWCIPLVVVAGVVAVIAAPSGLPRVLVVIYALGLLSMFTFSALFHYQPWESDRVWWRLRQLDHTGIYLVIAGSFTGIGGLALEGTARWVLLGAVWTGSLLGIAYRWLPLVPPFGLTTAIYIAVGATVVPFLPAISDSLGVGGTVLLLAGCALYLFGAFALGARVPKLAPDSFGYHEFWHVLVVAASALHYVTLMKYALPAAEALAAAA